MIVEVSVAGVLLPGLLVLAAVGLLATVVALRLLTLTGARRLFVHRPLVEIATFALIYGLLAQAWPFTGLFL